MKIDPFPHTTNMLQTTFKTQRKNYLNIMLCGKRKHVYYEQFLRLLQYFQNASACGKGLFSYIGMFQGAIAVWNIACIEVAKAV